MAASTTLPERDSVLRSYEPRRIGLKESDDSTTLGQKNGDGPATRTKITHVQLGRLGIIGTVFSVTYGTWEDRPAACLVLGYNFLSGTGPLRFKRAEIHLSFSTSTRDKSSGAGSAQPAVVFFYPRRYKTSSVVESSPPHEREAPFSIKGNTWSQRKRDVAHQVFWVVTADSQSTSGIPDQICLFVIVASDSPFEATVGASAKLEIGVKLQSLPWSADEPLLFDGVTPKGPQMDNRRFEALDDSSWEGWSTRFYRQGSFTPSTLSTSSTSILTASSIESVPEAQAVVPQLAFRVKAIPANWSEQDTINRLTEFFGVKDRVNGISVLSFTWSAFSHRAEKCAVVAFPCGTPQILQDKKESWTFHLQQVSDSALGSKAVTLTFDLTFEGFTPLGKNVINNPEHIKADIIAIPGLGGHAYGSFKERGGSHMWLQDLLVNDVQLGHDLSTQGYVRVLTYGYKSHIAESQSFQDLLDLGGRLQMSIREIRSKTQPKRPIIFIAHSLGGLVVKEAMIRMSMGDEVDRSNLRAIVGALFFGVPNKGMDITSLVPMAGNQPNSSLLKSISVGSSMLPERNQVFEQGFPFRKAKIVSIHETRLSPAAIQEGLKWSMTGPPTILVDRESATHGRSWETTGRFILGLDRDHSSLVKFSYRCDDYEIVFGYVRDLLLHAQEVVDDNSGVTGDDLELNERAPSL